MALDDGPSRVSDVADRLGTDGNNANQYRRRLIDAELIEPAGHSFVSSRCPTCGITCVAATSHRLTTPQRASPHHPGGLATITRGGPSQRRDKYATARGGDHCNRPDDFGDNRPTSSTTNVNGRDASRLDLGSLVGGACAGVPACLR